MENRTTNQCNDHRVPAMKSCQFPENQFHTKPIALRPIKITAFSYPIQKIMCRYWTHSQQFAACGAQKQLQECWFPNKICIKKERFIRQLWSEPKYRTKHEGKNGYQRTVCNMCVWVRMIPSYEYAERWPLFNPIMWRFLFRVELLSIHMEIIELKRLSVSIIYDDA